jgi:quercetin dioxygenase-like cupin family protein
MKVFRSRDVAMRPVDVATFVGHADVQRLAEDADGVPVGLYRVEFRDGGRTNWHRHSGPQWLFIIDGRVRAQRWGEPHVDLEAGDAVVFAPNEKHWHGARPGADGSHLAINVNVTTDWLEPVSAADYSAR